METGGQWSALSVADPLVLPRAVYGRVAALAGGGAVCVAAVCAGVPCVCAHSLRRTAGPITSCRRVLPGVYASRIDIYHQIRSVSDQ